MVLLNLLAMNIVYVRVFLLAVGLASCIDAGNLTYHDVSSEEFRKMARKTYDKVIPCIESAWMMSGKSIKWEFPSDAQSHYELIKNRTGSYRSAPVHEYANYEGPWIENIFIKEFIDRPLHRFGGFIPIFVQWIDNQILRGRYFDYIHSELNELLRPNVLYLAISQGDVGLGKIGIAHPNILVLSAGGFGHVVLPLVKSIVPEVPIKEYKHDIGFYGSVAGRSTRPELLKIIRENAEYFHMTYRQGYGMNYLCLVS